MTFPIAWLRRLIPALLFICLPIASAMAGPYAAYIAEPDSERVLYERYADEPRHPASLTKMMTLYLLFEALANHELSMETRMRASVAAVNHAPSKLGLRAGETLTVEEAILGLVTRSANDAACVIAEHMAGSESAFAYLMTEKARELGMRNTTFRNASGLPDPNQWTSARDMYKLGRALLKRFPQFYGFFSTPSFMYNGHNYDNHNHLMERYPGMDGIKTGFINSSGFNLVASAKRNGNRLIGAVFGGTSAVNRDNLMAELLDDGFDQLDGQPPRQHLVAWDPADAAAIAEAAADIENTGEGLPRRYGRAAPPPPNRYREPLDGRPAPRPVTARNNAFIKVGEFLNAAAAERRLAEVMKIAPAPLKHARALVQPQDRRGHKMFVTQYHGLSREDAEAACQLLVRKHLDCQLSP